MPDSPMILTVCTGNVCRSPLVERLLVAGLHPRWDDPAGDVRVESAGTQALVGQPMTAETAANLHKLGGSDEGFAARLLELDMVTRATLVLALTRRHRSAVVAMHPRASSYTFTLRELARLVAPLRPEDLAGAAPGIRVRSLVTAAAALRGLVPILREEDDDVLDPYRQDEQQYALTAAQIAPAVHTIVRLLAPPAQASAQ